MALAGLQFDVLDYTQELTEQNALFYVERLITESNTGGNDMTPTLTFDADSTVSFTAINTSTRGFTQTDIALLGPLVTLQLGISGLSALSVAVHSLELHLRRVTMKLNILQMQNGTVEIMGRSVDPSTSMRFDINPFELPEEAKFTNPLPKRLYIDIKTAAAVTPYLVEDDGTATALTAISQATRDTVEFAILSGRRLAAIRLDGDFTAAGTVLYDIVLDTYIPAKRSLSVG